MADTDRPNRASNMEKAEGSRETTDQNIADEYPEGTSGEGITNRPIDEEIDNQKRVPGRGDTKGNAHAG